MNDAILVHVLNSQEDLMHVVSHFLLAHERFIFHDLFKEFASTDAERFILVDFPREGFTILQ